MHVEISNEFPKIKKYLNVVCVAVKGSVRAAARPILHSLLPAANLRTSTDWGVMPIS